MLFLTTNKLIKNSFLAILFVFIVLSASSQDSIKKTNDLILGFKCHYGFIIDHHKSMQHLTTGHFPSAEFSIGKATTGNKQWQSLYGYPEIGICLFYSGLANDTHLGKIFAIYPYINFPIFKSDIYKLSFRFGTGLSYITKPFSLQDNYKNFAIGSHLNAAINLHFENNFNITKQILFNIGIGLSHFSNGAFKMPNLGINIPTISSGVYYKFNKTKYLIEKKDTLINRKIKYLILATAGIKEINPVNGPKYGTYALSFCALKPMNLKKNIGIGLDLFYDSSTLQLLKNANKPPKSNIDIIKIGINATYEIIISKVSINIQLGDYLYNVDKSHGSVYEKLACRYYVSKSLFTEIALKANTTVADNFSIGVGYKF